jgi:hypothetical protein
MTQPGTTQRMTRIDSIDMPIDVALDYPYDTLDEVIQTGDQQLLLIVQCAEAVTFYTEELHAPTELTQFLTDVECAQVAAFIDSLGPNPERATWWFEPRHGFVTRGFRDADSGWNAELTREALRAAAQRASDAGVSENVTDCIVILQTFVAYLDKLHGSSGFQEVLTPDERTQVGQFVTELVTKSPE